MITKTNPIRETMLKGPATVKQIAAASGKSEARVREVIKDLGDEVETRKDGAKAAEFWLEPKDGRTDPLPEPEAPVEDKNPEGCPLCGADADVQKKAGPTGTFLGACNICGSCGKTYNTITRQEVTSAAKKKRTPLNPQPKINAKIDAVKAAGGTLTYERDGRTWLLVLPGQAMPLRMTALEFSKETPATIVAKK